LWLGPRAEIEMTPRVSAGTVMQELSTSRGYADPGGKSGLVSSSVGLPRSVFWLPSAPTGGDPVGPGEVDRPLGDDPDRPLLGLGLRGVGRVVEAVVQPRVGVEAHVDHVDPDQAGVDHGVHGGLEKQEAAVLPAADVDQLDLGRDAGHPAAVQRRGDDPGDVGAVAVVVDVRRVDA
jgi:hypothetical protein